MTIGKKKVGEETKVHNLNEHKDAKCMQHKLQGWQDLVTKDTKQLLRNQGTYVLGQEMGCTNLKRSLLKWNTSEKVSTSNSAAMPYY
jgi:hypothetical protein